MKDSFSFFLGAVLGAIIAIVVMAAGAAFFAAIIYASWNLVLAPWLEMRDMPVSVAFVIGLVPAFLSAWARRS